MNQVHHQNSRDSQLGFWQGPFSPIPPSTQGKLPRSQPTYPFYRHTALCRHYFYSSCFNSIFTFFFAFQIFARKEIEDGRTPCTKWALDRIGSDLDDPDSEDHMPIPDAGPVPVSGKPRSRDPLLDWSNDDSEDCQILEVHSIIPLAYKPPLPQPPVNPRNQVQDPAPDTSRCQAGTRKRPSAEPTAAAPAATQAKRVKKTAAQHHRPVSHG